MNETTVTVKDADGFDPDSEADAIMIDDEVMEILPLGSQEGSLFIFTDGKKAAPIRLKRRDSA